jgi:hypothetical protein
MKTSWNSLGEALRDRLVRRESLSIDTLTGLESLLLEADREIMDAPMTCSHDHNFVALLIPHCRGAIALAKAELLYGTNPVLRQLAQEMIAAHQREIRVLQQQITEMTKRAKRSIPVENDHRATRRSYAGESES